MSSPIIVGAAQYTQHKNISPRLDPLKLMVKTSQEALNQTESFKLKDCIDSIYMININSWSYEDAPKELSNILGIHPSTKTFLPDGGNTPQMLLNRAAKAISSKKINAVLITGGEAKYSTYLARKGRLELDWPEKKDPLYMEGALWNGINPFVNKYIYRTPPYIYALFETAIRAQEGRNLEEHRNYMGKLFSHFSEVASKNPYSWTKKSFSTEQITTPTKENRYIVHPYTKRMCSNMFVDQAGSLIMTSEAMAKHLKIDEKFWVYVMGGADLNNIHDITKKPNLYDSPAAREGSRLALKQAGLELKDIDAFDLYSCFPSIVEINMKELGIKEDDPRDLTLTGGLPYSGGPWSTYSLLAIITAIQRIQENPSLKIMVVANGGYNTKESFGIYGKNPPKIPWTERDDNLVQEKILNEILSEHIEEANGIIEVDAYTFPYDRNGNPIRGVVLGRLEENRRTLAYIEAEPSILKELEKNELVGEKFKVKFDPKTGLNKILLEN